MHRATRYKTAHKHSEKENPSFFQVRYGEDMLSALIESIQDEVWFADENGKFTLVNRAGIEEFSPTIGEERDVQKMAASLEVFRPDGTPRPIEETPPLRALQGEIIKNQEEIVRTPATGELRHRQVSSAPVRNKEGRIVGSVSIVRDVTDRKLAEEKLRESECEKSLILDNANEIIAFHDTCNNLIWANKAYVDTTGLPLSELKGRKCYSCWGLEQYCSHCPVVIAIQTGEREEGELTPQTQPHWPANHGSWHIRAAAVKNSVGKIVGAIEVAHDITDRKKAEDDLRLSEARFRRLAESNIIGIVFADSGAGRVFDANDEYLRIIGRSREEMLNGRISWEAIMPPEELRRKEAFIHDLKSGEKVELFEKIYVRPDGMQVPVVIGGSSMPDDPQKIVAVVLDVSKRKRAEQALRDLNATLEQRIEERTGQVRQKAEQLRALATQLSMMEQRERRRLAKFLHDHLQQLLVAAKFHIAVLGRSVDDPARKAAKEIEDLIDESIAASRSLTAELSPPILHEAGLSAGLQWLARRMADRHGLFVNLEMEEIGSLPGDLSILLFESVRELLFNVVKHARTRSAIVSLRHVDRSLLVTVSDQGIGFDPKAVPRAGELGGGFGLFGVRERLEIFEGKLEIASMPGQGSRIVLSVPMPEPAALESQSGEICMPPERADAARITSAVFEKKIRVMLVDDHNVVRQGIANLIGNQPDFEIVGEAGDGQEAVEGATQLLPDVILMDMSMPKLNGIEATRIIHSEFPDIRIIGLSMFEEAERAQAMRDAGAVAYIAKSGPAEELINAIRTHVNPSRKRLYAGIRSEN